MGCNPRLFHPHLCWRVRLHGPLDSPFIPQPLLDSNRSSSLTIRTLGPSHFKPRLLFAFPDKRSACPLRLCFCYDFGCLATTRFLIFSYVPAGMIPFCVNSLLALYGRPAMIFAA